MEYKIKVDGKFVGRSFNEYNEATTEAVFLWEKLNKDILVYRKNVYHKLCLSIDKDSAYAITIRTGAINTCAGKTNLDFFEKIFGDTIVK